MIDSNPRADQPRFFAANAVDVDSMSRFGRELSANANGQCAEVMLMRSRHPNNGSAFSKPTYKARRLRCSISPERQKADAEQVAIDCAKTRAINTADGGRSWALSYLARIANVIVAARSLGDLAQGSRPSASVGRRNVP